MGIFVLVLTDFRTAKPKWESPQRALLDWWLEAALVARQTRYGTSAEGASGRERVARLIERSAAFPPAVETRAHEVGDFTHRRWDEMEIYRLKDNPRGAGLSRRMEFHAQSSLRAFRELYSDPGALAPDEIIHVSCTGYTAPSPAQLFVESRGWGRGTRITPAYHGGCHSVVSALRQAWATASTLRHAGVAHAEIDIVHTEVCSVHANPFEPTAEQAGLQSLFGDGFIRYGLREWDGKSPAFAVRALVEEILPNTTREMRCVLDPYTFHLEMSRSVGETVAAAADSLLEKLARKGDVDRTEFRGMPFALHPGGPRLVETLQDVLRLENEQLVQTRSILAHRGNMASASLPHIWQCLLLDLSVARGTLIPSLSFGPGLTLAGVLLEKVG